MFHIRGPEHCKSFILCFHTKTIRAKKAKVHFAYFVQGDQGGKVAKHFTDCEVLFEWDVFIAAAVVAS